jgi:tetratricopeptide (TPR) repeat protein
MNNGAKALPAAVRTELVALYTAGNWEQLRVAAGKATARHPRQLLGWQALGKALLQLRKLAEAVDVLSRLVKLAPGEADGHNDLGTALHEIGRKNEAVASYRRAVALNPRFAQAHSNLGRTLCDLGKSAEAVACCRRALELDPGSPFTLNNLGNALRALGQFTEAEASCRQALALRPDLMEVLISLGTVLADQGRWAEARSTYRLAVQLHPTSAIALGALGGLLSRLTGDDEEATLCLQRALALNPDDSTACVDLGNVLMRKQQTEAALGMFRRAQTLQPLITWRANQENAEFSVLLLDTPMAGSTPINYLAGRASYDRHFHAVLPDTPADVAMLRAKADVVFNMIANADDGREILPQALDLADRIGRPTVNHPRVIMNTDRETVARRLAGVPYCVVPKTIHVAGAVLAKAASVGEFAGFRLPLLVRLAGKHGGDDFDMFSDWADVTNFAAKNTESDHYLIEYVDYRSDDGLFRKYRIIFIDGEILPYHLAIHDDWKVHHFRTDMANHAWMRQEEERFLQDMGRVFNPAHQDALRAIANATELDYGGIDCGLTRDGQIVVFEANAVMLVHNETDANFTYKNPYIAKIKSAFDAMLSRRRMSG